MGTTEIATALGVTKGLVSQLAARGMPLTSPQAAQAWRMVHAPPRKWKSKSAEPIPQKIVEPPKSEKDQSETFQTTAQTVAKQTGVSAQNVADDPAQSLTRAREAERSAYLALQDAKDGSPEDLRKSSATYFASRSNHQRAMDYHDEWKRRQGITLLFDEARELAGRPHVAAKQILEVAAKTLAPRLVGQPQKMIEKTIDHWIDKLTDTLRSSL
jgi:hypothetical protein